MKAAAGQDNKLLKVALALEVEDSGRIEADSLLHQGIARPLVRNAVSWEVQLIGYQEVVVEIFTRLLRV